LVPLPDTRDYKRAFDGDKGPNTGGMGSYKAVDDWLPYMTSADRETELQIVDKIFQKLKGKGSNPNLRGVPFYVAFVHTGEGPKIFENNSRPGDPEIINLLPILQEDLVNVCYKMIEGTLRGVKLERKATVVTYKVPPTYGGYMNVFPERVDLNGMTTPIDLRSIRHLNQTYGEKIRFYPGSMELRGDEAYALRSRTICVVGVGDTIQTARETSLDGLRSIKGGSLWNRNDVASREHIANSIAHMHELRR
jgi:phosphoribosylamine--glycine ligase